MALFKVVHEIEVEAESPLKAAKTVQQWMDDADTKWQFYVQETDSKEVFSVDLSEDDEDAVLPVGNYEPLIKQTMTEEKRINMTEDEFYEKYTPVKNHLDNNASFDGCMFETYGKEVDHIRELNSNTDTDKKIWTIIEAENNIYYLSGYHWVNRLGFLVTEEAVPEDVEIEVKLNDNDDNINENGPFDQLGYEQTEEE